MLFAKNEQINYLILKNHFFQKLWNDNNIAWKIIKINLSVDLNPLSIQVLIKTHNLI